MDLCVYILGIHSLNNIIVSDLHCNFHASKFSAFSIHQSDILVSKCFLQGQYEYQEFKTRFTESCAVKYEEWSLWY